MKIISKTYFHLILAFCTPIITFLYLWHNSTWDFFGVPAFHFIFSDLHILLSAIDGNKAGFEVIKNNPLSFNQIPHVYSRSWFILDNYGFSDNNRTIIAIITLVAYLIISIGIIHPEKDIYRTIVFYSFILSPAIILGFERCNNDYIIFMLLMISLFFIRKTSGFATSITHLILFFAATLKYYPVACCTIFLVRNEKTIVRITNIFIQIILFAIWVIFIWSDLKLQQKTLPYPGANFSFGFGLLINFIIDKIDMLSNNVVILMVILSTVSIIFCFFSLISPGLNNLKGHDYNMKNRDIYLFITGSSILCFCYFVKPSFDYRFIFFVLCIPFLLNYNNNLIQKSKFFFFLNPRILLSITIFSLWFEALREWTSLFLNCIQAIAFIPHFLFLIRLTELLVNHLIFVILVAYTLGIMHYFNIKRNHIKLKDLKF